jgi:hypothetical protein
VEQPPWAALARRQSGLLARRQLRALGVDRFAVRNQVRAGRWVLRSPRVVSVTTGTLTFPQRVWLGVLHAGPRAAVGGLTAASMHGLRGWSRPAVCVLVPADLPVDPVPGIDFVRTRRDLDELVLPRSPAQVCRLEPAVLLFASTDPSARTAAGLLAAVVQQRLTTPEELSDWVDRLHPVRRAASFRATLADIAGGAQSLGELDVGRVCRRFGLPQPSRQVRRRDRDGVLRFTDCEWTTGDGRVVVLEVDGGFHRDAAHWAADMGRERGLVVEGVLVLRCTSEELRRSPGRVVDDLRALGVGRESKRAL